MSLNKIYVIKRNTNTNHCTRIANEQNMVKSLLERMNSMLNILTVLITKHHNGV